MESQPLTELETIQTRILDRISKLEVSVLSKASSSSASLSSSSCSTTRTLDLNTPSDGKESTTVSRLSAILRSIGVNDFCFKRVPTDYYDRSLEERRDILGAHSVDHLCKSIVMVNTQAPSDVVDCSNPNNSKYYVVVVQYTTRLNAEAIKTYLYSLNNGKVPKKKFNMRLAPEETSLMLTGFEHNAVTCIGMKSEIPVILDEAIVKLTPDFFWLGGGEVDLKLGIRTSEFVNSIKPFIVNCSING